MPKLTRYLQKIFANNSNQVGVFGTGVDKETSKNVETLQSADYENGWSSAIITNKNYPIWQEMDGVQYGLSYQLKYLFQNGIPEWISTETYYTNNYCSYGGYIYQSLQDDNINHNPALNDGYWTVYSSVSDDRLHALKSYLDKGELLTDSEGLADVKEYSHSTFDKSKFTVTGSPIITDDGIASGFSSSNHVITILLPYDKLNYCITLKDYKYLGGQSFIFGNRNISNNQSLNVIFNDNRILLFASSTGTGWDIADATISSSTFATGNTYDISFVRENGSLYKVVVYDHSNNTTTTEITVTTNSNLFNSQNLIAIGAGSWEAYTGSIDLKQFSITIDGVEVFSGNRTGIDTIKPDDYTVVGTPTISADGILSNISASNKITIPSSYTGYNFSNGFEFQCRCKTPTTVPSSFHMLASVQGFIGTVNDKFQFRDDTNNKYITDISFDLNTWYDIKVGYNPTTKKNYFSLKKVNGGTWTTTESNVINSYSSNTTISGIGISGNNYPWEGEIDLNTYKVYIAGSLIYQPCLKIPYTESKTGSKIVQSPYRDRVSDMYSQSGYAPYYTLSDTDFTLPQGEIYGMHVNKGELKEVHCVIETYVNDTSWYRVYSDGWCEQGGYSDANSSTVVFLKEFKDTNYNIVTGFCSVGPSTTDSYINVSSIATTGFSFAHSAGFSHYWQAMGYIS